MKSGLTSVIVPTHNRSDLLIQTLDSAFASEADVEVIVVDDASTDDTPQVMAQRAAGHPAITFLRSETNIGACRARNLGLERAEGEFTMFLDSDDLLHRSKIPRQVELLRSDPNLDAPVAQMAHFHERPGDCDVLWNTFAGDAPTVRYLRHDPVWGIHAPLWRTEVIRALGGLDESLPMAQDFELHARALLRGVRFRLVPELTTFCRRHSGPSISGNRQIKRLSTLSDVLDRLERIRNLTAEERDAIIGTRLWLADLASTQQDGSLAKRALQAARTVPLGFGTMTWLNRLTRRHRFHAWARSAAYQAGHNLEVRESWYFRHRVANEPDLLIPEDVAFER